MLVHDSEDPMEIPDTMKGETTPYVNFLIMLHSPCHGKGLVLLRLFPDDVSSAIMTEDKRRLISPNDLPPTRGRLVYVLPSELDSSSPILGVHIWLFDSTVKIELTRLLNSTPNRDFRDVFDIR